MACLASRGLLLCALAALSAVRGGDLHEATFRGDAAAVARLLDEGHSPDERTEDNPSNYRGGRPLHFAARHGQPLLAVLLLERGADPNKVNDDNVPPIAVALYHALSPDAPKDAAEALEVAEILFEYGASLDGTEPQNRDGAMLPPLHRPVIAPSLLHMAATRGDASDRAVVSWAVERHAILDTGDAADLTPLHHAAASGTVEMVELLLKLGAPIDGSHTAMMRNDMPETSDAAELKRRAARPIACTPPAIQHVTSPRQARRDPRAARGGDAAARPLAAPRVLRVQGRRGGVQGGGQGGGHAQPQGRSVGHDTLSRLWRLHGPVSQRVRVGCCRARVIERDTTIRVGIPSWGVPRPLEPRGPLWRPTCTPTHTAHEGSHKRKSPPPRSTPPSPIPASSASAAGG